MACGIGTGSALDKPDVSINVGEATQGFREVDTQTLLRAKPSKDGDAELRGYREPIGPPCLPGRQRIETGGFFLSLTVAGAQHYDVQT